jgi:rubrerythrin
MSLDFEFKQLLRAYRNGVISQATFESEMAWLEAGAPTNGNSKSNGGGFKAFDRTYKSERAAVVSFLDKVRAGEANGGEAFAAWAEVCTTDCIRTGLRMIAEREAYHSRIFAQRLTELGGEKRASTTEDGRKFTAYLGNPSISDNEKLLSFTKRVGKPEDAIKPICEFADLLKEDLSTKEALRLFAEDELSSTKWVWDACAALNAPRQQTSESKAM